jgi:hypothetical protein
MGDRDLFPSFYSHASVVPPLVKGTGPGGEPIIYGKATNTYEQNFKNDIAFCYRMAGSHTSPPYGAQLLMKDNKDRMAQWLSCMAQTTAPLHQCFMHVLRYARFNQKDYPELFNASKEYCKGVRDRTYGGKLDASYDDCAYGLSQAECYRLQNADCLDPGRAVAANGSGAKFFDGMKMSDTCGTSVATRGVAESTQHLALMEATAALLASHACWAGTEGRSVTLKDTTAQNDEGERLEERPPAKKTGYRGRAGRERPTEATLPRAVEQ